MLSIMLSTPLHRACPLCPIRPLITWPAHSAPSQGLPTLPHLAPALSIPSGPCPLCFSLCLPTLPLPMVPPCFSPVHSAQPVDTVLISDLFSCVSHSRLFKVLSSPPFPLYLNLLRVPPSLLFQPHLDFPTLCLSLSALHLLWPSSRLKACSLPEQRGTARSHCEKKAGLHFSHTSFGVTVIDPVPSVDSPGPSVHQSGFLS